ncbi:MAG: GTPase ObgE [Actinomycetes bacterium]
MSGFVDECNLNVRGGDGGAGCVSTRREAHVPLGGPDGGDGGSGGDVWLVADRNVASLLSFRDHPHRRATNGVHGSGAKKHGKRGIDKIVHVPEGTSIFDQSGALLADLLHQGDRWLGAAGGQGGKGNARFLSNRRRAPSFAEQGEEGEERWLRLELKLMADVALVGFPNVGKSTLISRISAAKPKIADYPFTTLEPNLGVVRTDEDHEFVVADIPGLIEGASEGKGLGHQFLRHVERARVLALLIDLTDDGMQMASPAEQERVLLQELGDYRPELLDRPRVVVGSKADLLRGESLQPDLTMGPDGEPPSGSLTQDGVHLDVSISAITGEGLPRAVGLMADAVRGVRTSEPEPEAFIVYRPVPEGIKVERAEDGGFRVLGRQATRAVALSDLTNLEALDHAHSRLRNLGVDKALAKAGAKQGDLVYIGATTFTYDEDGI